MSRRIIATPEEAEPGYLQFVREYVDRCRGQPVDLAKDFRAFFLAGVNYTPQKLTPRRQGRPPKQHNVAAQAVEKEQP